MGSVARSQDLVRVHLASRDVLTVAGLRQLLKPCSFVAVVGTSATEAATVTAVSSTSPDVLVISAAAEQEIHALAHAARNVCEGLKVVALADEAVVRTLAASRQTRLEGILVRGGDHLEDISAVLRIVHRGGRVVSEYHSAPPVVTAPQLSPRVTAQLASLTAREMVILQDLARGRTNAQIAAPLHLSVATIKADLAHIMHVLGAGGRVELAVLAVHCGMVPADFDPTAAGDAAERARRSRAVKQMA